MSFRLYSRHVRAQKLRNTSWGVLSVFGAASTRFHSYKIEAYEKMVTHNGPSGTEDTTDWQPQDIGGKPIVQPQHAGAASFSSFRIVETTRAPGQPALDWSAYDKTARV